MDIFRWRNGSIGWRKIVILPLLTTIFILSVPQSVLAWGPVTHGAHFESMVKALDEPYKSIVRENKEEFIYGSTFPDFSHLPRFEWLVDMVMLRWDEIGGENNRYEAIKKDINPNAWMHNYHIGLEMLNKASNDKEAAFALGFLSHLIGDAVQDSLHASKVQRELGTPTNVSETMSEIYQPRINIEAARTAFRHRDPCVLDLFYKVITEDNREWTVVISREEFDTYVQDWENLMKVEQLGLFVKNLKIFAPLRWAVKNTYRYIVYPRLEDKKWDAIFDSSTYDDLPGFYEQAAEIFAASIRKPSFPGQANGFFYWKYVSQGLEGKMGYAFEPYTPEIKLGSVEVREPGRDYLFIFLEGVDNLLILLEIYLSFIILRSVSRVIFNHLKPIIG